MNATALQTAVRRGDGLVALGGVLALVASVVVLVAGPRAGLSVLCLGLAVALLGLARVVRVVLRRLDRVDGRLRRQGGRVRRQSGAVRRLQVSVRATGEGASAETRAATEAATRAGTQATRVGELIERDLERRAEVERALTLRLDAADQRRSVDALRFRTSIDTLPSDLLRLERHLALLAPGSTRLPGLGDWAITPGTLVALLDEIEQRPDLSTVVECGSGASTLYLALALAGRPDGRVTSLESDPGFAEETRALLRHHGVDDRVAVIDAPLTEVALPSGEVRHWFDLGGLPVLPPIDLLFVDGPVGGSAPLARIPALPLLGDRLAPGAMVVLDDTDRPDEQEILRRWLDDPGMPPLDVVRRNVRSTFLRVAPTEGA